MLEARKCARCGVMYLSNTEVCENCKKKDGADIYKLRGFLEQSYGDLTQGEIAVATGISDKNLSRFLQYDEFKGIFGEKEVVESYDGDEAVGEISEMLDY